MEFPIFNKAEIESIKQMDYDDYLELPKDENFYRKLYNTLPLMYDSSPLSTKDEMYSFQDFLQNPTKDSSFYWLLQRGAYDSNYNPEIQELPEVTVSPTYMQTQFIKQNPIFRYNNNFFKDADKDTVERFYYLWNQAGRPDIKINPNIRNSMEGRAHMSPITRTITLGPKDNVGTAISELAHIFEINNAYFQHSPLDVLMTTEELFDQRDRYNTPGTNEFKTHQEVEPSLRNFVFYNEPSKYIPKTPITSLQNFGHVISNIFTPPSYKQLIDWIKLK